MGVYLRAGVWYLRWRTAHGQVRRKATTATNERAARQLLSEVLAQAQRVKLGLDEAPVLSRETLADLVNWYLDERCPEPSREIERARLKKHVLPKLGKLPLTQVTSDVLERRFEAMSAAGLAPATVNRVRTTLHAVWAAAGRPPRRWHGRNPVTATSRRKVTKVERPTLTPEQIPQVLAQVPEDWRGVMAVAAYLGLRKGEIFALRRSDWDRHQKTLRVAASHQRDTTKGGRLDVLPVPEVLEPYLSRALEWKSKPTKVGEKPVSSVWLFPGRSGAQRTKESDPHLVLRAAAGRAGVVEYWETWCRKCVELGRVVLHVRHQTKPVDQVCRAHENPVKLWVHAEPRAIRFHDLRHSCASNLIKAGVPLPHVQRILRHSSIRTTIDIYGHLDVEDLRASTNAVQRAQPAQQSHENEAQTKHT